MSKWILIYILVLSLGVYILLYVLNTGNTVGEINEEKMLWAIKKSEGGKFPYGIRPPKCNSEYSCRNYARKRIRNYSRDYFKESFFPTTKGFIRYSAYHYVGSNDRIGQENWYKNVKYFYFKNN